MLQRLVTVKSQINNLTCIKLQHPPPQQIKSLVLSLPKSIISNYNRVFIIRMDLCNQKLATRRSRKKSKKNIEMKI